MPEESGLDKSSLDKIFDGEKMWSEAVSNTDAQDLLSLAYAALEKNQQILDDSSSFRCTVISTAEAKDHIRAALGRRQNAKSYGTKALLTMYWENDDVGGKRDSKKIRDLLQDELGFLGKSFKIPIRNSLAKVKGTITSFIGDHDEQGDNKPRSLLIFHYAGHGEVDKKDRTYYIFGNKDGKGAIKFTPLRIAMLECQADVLIILDCCYAAAAIRGRDAGERTVEIICTSGQGERTWSYEDSFTHYLDMAARKLLTRGTFDVEELIQSLDVTHASTQRTPLPPPKKRSRKPVQNQNGLPYHTVPIHRRWMGSASIQFESRNSVTPSSLSPTGLRTPRECFVAVIIHLAEDSSSASMAELSHAIESLPVEGAAVTAKVILQLRSNSTLALVSLPLTIWQCMSFHPAFTYIGNISADDPCILRPSSLSARPPILNFNPGTLQRMDVVGSQLSQIVAKIESQNPDATLEQVYEWTGNHLRGWRPSQNTFGEEILHQDYPKTVALPPGFQEYHDSRIQWVNFPGESQQLDQSPQPQFLSVSTLLNELHSPQAQQAPIQLPFSHPISFSSLPTVLPEASAQRPAKEAETELVAISRR